MWLPINENYDISSEGQVWSKRYLRLLKPYLSHSYYSIRMGNSKSKKYPIHQLVAKAFLPAPTEEGSVIDHIDRNKLNNNASNLRWVSRSTNSLNRDCESKPRKHGTNEHCGIYKSHNRWISKITIKGILYQQRFDDINEAITYRNNIINQHAGKNCSFA